MNPARAGKSRFLRHGTGSLEPIAFAVVVGDSGGFRGGSCGYLKIVRMTATGAAAELIAS
jgi:hypothetical protein